MGPSAPARGRQSRREKEQQRHIRQQHDALEFRRWDRRFRLSRLAQCENNNMGDRLLELLDFFLERPPLTGALVAGALYLLKRKRKAHFTDDERNHALDLANDQRTYADKMYDPPTDEEQSTQTARTMPPARPRS